MGGARRSASADKPVLIGSVLVVTLLLAGVAGVLARRRFARRRHAADRARRRWPACRADPARRRPVDALPALATAVVGLAVLGYLTRGGRITPRPRPAGESGPLAPRLPGRCRRRDRGGGGARGHRPADHPRAQQDLRPGAAQAGPAAARRWPPAWRRPTTAMSTFVTPRGQFYRVDTNLQRARSSTSESWKLTIDGDVENELTLSFDDLTKMDVVEKDITLTCVSNEVGGNLVGSARWLGVPLQDVLDLAGVGHQGRPDPLHRGRRLHHPHPAEGGPGRPQHPARLRHERRAAAPRARLPGAAGHPRPLRLRRLDEVAPEAHPDDVRRAGGLLDQAQVGHRRPDQALQPRRHPATRCPRSTPGRPSSPASPGPSPTASPRSRSASTAASGRRPSSARTPAWSTGASGTSPGTPTPAATRSPCAPPTRRGDVQIDERATPFPAGSSGIQEVVVTVCVEISRTFIQSAGTQRSELHHVTRQRKAHHEEQHHPAHRPRGPGAHHVAGHGCLRLRRLLQRLVLHSASRPQRDPLGAREQPPPASERLRCRLLRRPADGAGSFQGMSTAPVATAASANPVL